MAPSTHSLIFGSLCMIIGIIIHHLFTTPSHLAASAALARQRALHGPGTTWTPPTLSSPTQNTTRQNATFITLARNSDVWSLARSIQSVEDRFNRHYHYDWVFLNDEPFTAEFKDVTSSLASGRVFYGQVPAAHWGYPAWINQTHAAESRRQAEQKAVMYAASESYRHMCRFFSGFFFRHELLAGYEYYWRVEPETEYFCEMREDPFRVLKEGGKMYGFTISLREDAETIRSLWGAVKGFVRKYPQHVVEGNSESWLSEDGGESYNGCHFWSNFEIGSLSWLRSQAYVDFFTHLDSEGGFFYERWGDAPVHSIAAALLLKKEQIHFFNEIAYHHPPYTHCPTGEPLKRDLKCSCNRAENVDWMDWSCLSRFYRLHALPAPGGYNEELPLIEATMKDRLEDDRIARAEMFAAAGQPQGGVLAAQGAIGHAALEDEAEIQKLRKANKAWKRMVRYLRQKEGMGEEPSSREPSGENKPPPSAGDEGGLGDEPAQAKTQRVLSSRTGASEVEKLREANRSWKRMVRYLMQRQGLRGPGDRDGSRDGDAAQRLVVDRSELGL